MKVPKTISKRGNIYSRGQWAASLRHNNGKFYVFFGTGNKSYLYSTDNPAGKWHIECVIDEYLHDASLLFDDNGKTYIAYGGSHIRIREFKDDLSGIAPDGFDVEVISGQPAGLLERWYAWAWSPSPGYTMVVDERTHGKLEKYVTDVMTRFKDDNRIFVWDLYNEPTNTTMPERSWPLLKKVFSWTRKVNPSQPISSGMWNSDKVLNDFLVDNSDIITFLCYASKEETENVLKQHQAHGRPVICTEWMNRVAKSYILDILPIFKEANVGCELWGLVNGKTQTHLCWGHRSENMPYTGEWQHDIFKKRPHSIRPKRNRPDKIINHEITFIV